MKSCQKGVSRDADPVSRQAQITIERPVGWKLKISNCKSVSLIPEAVIRPPRMLLLAVLYLSFRDHFNSCICSR